MPIPGLFQQNEIKNAHVSAKGDKSYEILFNCLPCTWVRVLLNCLWLFATKRLILVLWICYIFGIGYINMWHYNSTKRFYWCVYFLWQFIDLSSAVLMSNLEAETKPNVLAKATTVSTLNATGGTSILNKPDNTQSTPTTLMVLSNPASTSNAVNGSLIVTSAPGSNASTVTVRAANSNTPIQGAKTIVVMPVSSAIGSGDAQNAKRLKVE